MAGSIRTRLRDWCSQALGREGAPPIATHIRRTVGPRGIRRGFRCAEPLEDRRLLAVEPSLLFDVNSNTASADPSSIVEVGGATYFVANDGVSGRELWKTDGTSTGTTLVEDIRPGSAGSNLQNLTNVGGAIYFLADDGVNGLELWKSDGTSSGTLIPEFVYWVGGDGPDFPTTVGGTLYFSAIGWTGGIDFGSELWKTDGTSTGTMLVKDIRPGSGSSKLGNLTDVGGTLYFTANDGVNGEELWMSDGTSMGTMLVKDIRPGTSASSPRYLMNVGGTLYFWANDGVNGKELWKSDGTSLGTTLVKDIDPGGSSSDPLYPTNVGGNLYFWTDDGGASGPRHDILWKSDGTSSGTSPVKEFGVGDQGAYQDRRTLVNVEGTLYFLGYGSSSYGDGYALWKSDGTSSGTMVVSDTFAWGGYLEHFGNLTNVGGTLYFTADGGTGYELWKSDGTSSGTILVKDIRPGSSPNPLSSYPGKLTNVGGTLYFQANDGFTGVELWKSDGTSSGTTLVNDIRTEKTYPSQGSGVGFFTNVGGTLFFVANDRETGRELWKSDGTSSGTSLVLDIFPYGSSSPLALTNVGGTIYFTANDGVNGEELWKSDGTSTGTTLVKDISPGALRSFPGALTNVGGTLYFTANDGVIGEELWKSDGTSTGTTLVKDISPGASNSAPRYLTNVGGTLYFRANDGVNGEELWKSDGTSTGTTLVKNIGPGARGSYPSSLTYVAGTLYFVADDVVHGLEPWILRPESPPALIGDATGDGQVGAADYAIWAAMFGQVGAGLAADFDGNGEVGAGDYTLWAANFGQTLGGAGAASGSILPGLPLASTTRLPVATSSGTQLAESPAPSAGSRFTAALARHADNLAKGEANRPPGARPAVAPQTLATPLGGDSGQQVRRTATAPDIASVRTTDWLFAHLGRRH